MRSNKEVRDDIIEKLTTVVDPELNIDIVNLGLIYNVDLDEDGICLVEMTLTTMGLADMVTRALRDIPEIKNVDVEFVWEPMWTTDRLSRYAKLALGIH